MYKQSKGKDKSWVKSSPYAFSYLAKTSFKSSYAHTYSKENTRGIHSLHIHTCRSDVSCVFTAFHSNTTEEIVTWYHHFSKNQREHTEAVQ